MITGASLIGALLLSASALAQAPSSAPAGATGQCKDGTFWTGETKKGACRGHKGVQSWWAATGVGAAATTPAAAPAAPAAPAPTAAAPAPAPAAAPAAKKGVGPASTVAQAPGGGPGLVWVNKPSHVYHCSTDKWYGKTKSGEYMSEADAIAKGDHADHGKACSK
jgi:pyruvate/2-oxoglutarate dehydrogenase complex dihydrolipoamide acyltransferase (E2) component